MKPISQTKLDTNRRNAQRSTGPKTAHGRAVSSRNATRHGLSSGTLTVLPNEDQRDLEALIRELNEQNEPKTPDEQFYVDQMIHARWNLFRIRRLEAEAFDKILENTEPAADLDRGIIAEMEKPGNILDKLARYAAAAGRAYSKAVRELAQLRANTQKTKEQNKAKDAEQWFAAELAKAKKRPLPAYLLDDYAPASENEATAPPRTMAARL